MKKYSKIFCFDFDGTLCHTPEPANGEKIFKEKTGLNWPYNGWWGKSESIDMNIFDIPVNGWVYKKYLEAISDDDAYVILATGRLEKVPNMRKNIEKILNFHNLSFDGVYLNTGGDTFRFKCKLFSDLVKELNVSELTMYDDRHVHLKDFEKWAVNQPMNVNIVNINNKEVKSIKNI